MDEAPYAPALFRHLKIAVDPGDRPGPLPQLVHRDLSRARRAFACARRQPARLRALPPGQIVLLGPWFSNCTKSLVKSPKLYLADTGLLCALLNIHSEEALRQSPSAGAIWETFVFAQLRQRERRAGRIGRPFFWRDRTREIDFVVEVEGRLELYEAKWTELPTRADAVNLAFFRDTASRVRIAGGAVVCRAPHGFPLRNDFRAIPVTELE